MNTALKKKYNIITIGNGPRIMIFAHGFGCDQSMWRFVTPAFKDDFTLILFDQMGAGESDVSFFDRNRYSTLHGYASDLIEIVDGLHLKDVIFIGHSVSAMVGVLAANQRADLFAKLVLVGPSPCYFKDRDYDGGFDREALEELLRQADSDYLGWSRSMAPAIMGRPDRPEFGVELTNSFCKTNAELAKHFARVLFLSDNRSDLKLLKTPSLILQCAQDIVAPERVGQYMHDQLPNSRLHFLKAVGHCPHVSEPEETIEAIRNFI